MKALGWIDAADLPGALAAGARAGALYKAGGVDLADRLKEYLEEPALLVNLRTPRLLAELGAVKEDKGALLLGPLLTLAQLSEDGRVARQARALAQAAVAAATPQIRNQATLGGNLCQKPRCWYYRNELFHCRRKGGDTCFALEGEHEQHAIFDNGLCAMVHPSGTATALVALGATLQLRSAKGERSLPLEQFFVLPATDLHHENALLPGELITEVRVPAQPRSAYLKLMQKESFDWPLADVGVALELQGGVVKVARIVLGAAAPVPHRALAAERALVGKPLDEASAAGAARLATEGATPLARNRHKLALFEVLVRRALLAAREPA